LYPLDVRKYRSTQVLRVSETTRSEKVMTMAFKEDGIENVGDIIGLPDQEVNDLTYLDSDPTITTAYSLKKGEGGSY
jgi:tryptophanase